MIQVTQLQEHEYPLWNAYIESHEEGTLNHLAQWAPLIKQVLGQTPYYFVAKNEQGNIVGALPIINLKSFLFGNFMVSMPYFNYGGVVADSDAISKQLVDAAVAMANKVGVSHIQFRASSANMSDEFHLSTHKVNMVLDLPETPELLGKAIGSKRRSQIKRPIREGVEHTFGGIELLDDFYDVFCINMRDLGTPVYSKSFFKCILETFKDNALICVVYWQGKPVSTGFLMHFKGKLEIPWASTVRYANRISVNMYLYWQILSYAIESGFSQFDFGRSSIDAGTYKFKKQWGAEPKQCYWYYYVPAGKKLPDLSPDNETFELAIKIWRKLPMWVTKAIGPSIVKNLP